MYPLDGCDNMLVSWPPLRDRWISGPRVQKMSGWKRRLPAEDRRGPRPAMDRRGPPPTGAGRGRVFVPPRTGGVLTLPEPGAGEVGANSGAASAGLVETGPAPRPRAPRHVGLPADAGQDGRRRKLGPHFRNAAKIDALVSTRHRADPAEAEQEAARAKELAFHRKTAVAEAQPAAHSAEAASPLSEEALLRTREGSINRQRAFTSCLLYTSPSPRD